jgi:thimet oligopeptidase
MAAPSIQPTIYDEYSKPDLVFYNDTEKLTADFKKQFEAIKAGFDQIDAIPYEQRTLENTLYRMDALFAQLDFPSIMILGYVSPDEAVREAALNCEEQVSEYLSAFSLRRDTYKALKELRQKYDGNLRPNEERFLDETIKDFELEGIQLDADKRARLEDINAQISKLSIEFGKNIREDSSSTVFSKDELKGLPETVLERLDRNEDGSYTVKADYPTYFGIMKYAELSKTRQTYNELYRNRAYPANIELLEKILTLKKEKATLTGWSAIRDLLIANKMAKAPEAVNEFLTGLVATISEKSAEDRAALKKVNGGKTVNYWDIEYLKNKIIQDKYNVDEEKVREYFSLETTLKGCMGIYEDLFSIKFKEVTPESTWHPDVKKYEVISEGKAIAAFYLDLFPRENKYSHAAQFGLRSGRLLPSGTYESPVVALVCNFTKPTKDKPSLLSLDEVTTFFHEFGHGMHSCLTTAELATQSGTSVKRDFVEAPSQMFERWLEKPEILNRFARHYVTGEPMPAELIENIVKLNYFMKAHTTTRQAFYALYDQAIHGPEVPESTTELWAKMVQEITKYGYPPNIHPEASFGHLVGGYSAGYYSYLWSEVMAVDMFARFEEEGLLNPELGMAYRVKVLSKGDSVDPEALVTDFLGRESNADAFLKSLQK